MISPLPILFGAGLSLAMLMLMLLLAAGLILGGALSASAPGMVLSAGAGLCSWVGSRISVGKGRGVPLINGSVTAGILCVILLLVCLGVKGEIAFHSQFIGTLLMILAGGGLAGLMGKKKKKPKKKKK